MSSLFWIFLHVFLVFWLCLPFTLIVISLFIKEAKIPVSAEKRPISIIITCYKNLGVSTPLIYSLLKQEYSDYHIHVVVDRPEQNLPSITHKRVSFLQPSYPLDSKLKSIHYALTHSEEKYQTVIVLDPDNLVPSFFLSRINDYLTNGFQVVQARRTAKNLDTMYACMDSLGETYKTYLERFVPYQLGGSANITGSGYGISRGIFKRFVDEELARLEKSQKQIIVAEDKLLQNFLLRNGYRIAFAEEVYVYDEKVATGEQVSRQRSRWILAYFQNIKPSLRLFFRGIMDLRIEKILFALLALYPPLFLTVAASFLVGLADIFVSVWGLVSLLVGLTIFSVTILWTLTLSDAPSEVRSVVWKVPLFIGRQFIGLLQMKRALRNFLPTTHHHKTSIEEMEGEESDLFISKTDS